MAVDGLSRIKAQGEVDLFDGVLFRGRYPTSLAIQGCLKQLFELFQ
jgi:hypothetical protein